MGELTEELNHLETLWLGLDLPVDNLRPGLPESVIREKLIAAGFNAPQPIIDWFSWHDGMPVTEPPTFFWPTRWEMMSLDEAIASSKQLDQLAMEEAELVEENIWWDQNFLHIGNSFSPPHLVAKLLPEEVEVHYVSWKDAEFFKFDMTLTDVVNFWCDLLIQNKFESSQVDWRIISVDKKQIKTMDYEHSCLV